MCMCQHLLRLGALLLVEVLLWMHRCSAYHLTSNVPVDCWPLEAEDRQMDTVDCGGLGLEWIGGPPPKEVEKGTKFNLTFRATVNKDVYENPAAFPGYNESEVRELCSRVCPEDIGSVNQNTCCVWHANVHTCHPSIQNSSCGPAICGPWVADDGRLSTQTEASYGPINKTFSAIDVQINFLGVNVVIAHLQVGRLHVIIGREVNVIPPMVCGDGVCSSERGESCETCSTDCHCYLTIPAIVVSVVVPATIVLVIVFTVTLLTVCYMNKRRLFFNESWIISHDSLKHTEMNNLVTLSTRSKSQSMDDLAVECKASFDRNSRLSSFTDVRNYEGRLVALKMIPRRSFVLTNTVRKEVFQIRQLDHPNICKFIGATLRDVTMQAIVMEYCPKGSLHDVLCNRDIPLNWGFRFSFISDIARGLAYLHNKRIYHTRLKSSNCLIDNRWTVKITDFGLSTLRSTDTDDAEGSNVLRKRTGSFSNLYRLRAGTQSMECLVAPDPKRLKVQRIYQAPEVRESKLTQIKHPPRPAADVYSFGIILVEVATRVDLRNLDKSALDSSLKPIIDLSDLTSSEPSCPCSHEYLDLIARCWAHSPLSRPTFELVKKTLDRISPNRESPFDMMMVMMEKYSKHLESLVAERTRQLVQEQKKTAKVLHSMLPRSVASDLIHGKPAPATSFQSATIFFSDIVGFTSLASSSTPMEIVNLLNELYTTFDDILDHFDVYKVETIGDAYMVVSGVPRVNGDHHAVEIASMGLQLLSASERFKVPHKPDFKLEIRAGVHTGPVCAGVVGMKMPRYCLFGDTVNTASRMESTSEAMKIQCSSATHQLLMKLGGFHLESRGRIAIKGKGYMDTWWIKGKEPA